MRYVLLAIVAGIGCLLAAAAFALSGDQRTITAVTVTSSSTQMIAGSRGPRLYLAIDNESATATIACSFGGTAAANTAGSYTITPEQTRTWGPVAPDNPLSGAPVNCISSSATSPATIESWP